MLAGEAIDLGLPSGTKWASFNMGADKPEESGYYYAWGEIDEDVLFKWEEYTHCDGDEDSCHDLGSDIAGTKYDAAHVKWGGNWRTALAPQTFAMSEVQGRYKKVFLK